MSRVTSHLEVWHLDIPANVFRSLARLAQDRRPIASLAGELDAWSTRAPVHLFPILKDPDWDELVPCYFKRVLWMGVSSDDPPKEPACESNGVERAGKRAITIISASLIPTIIDTHNAALCPQYEHEILR